MIDREQVIRDLENLGAWHTHHYAPFHYEAAETIHNAIALLREQTRPLVSNAINKDKSPRIMIHNCGEIIVDCDVCPKCGQVVRWYV